MYGLEGSIERKKLKQPSTKPIDNTVAYTIKFALVTNPSLR